MNQIRLTVYLLAVAVIALVVLVYWPGLQGPFLLDDIQNIGTIDLTDKSFSALKYEALSNSSGPLGRVVTIVSFIISGLIHGEGPWGFKLDNLLLHCVTGLILYRLLTVLLPRLDARLSANRVQLIAGATATCWLLHPLLISTVMYTVQRMALLSALFSLLALLSYCYFRLSREGGLQRYVYGWLLYPLFGLLAIFSKETGVLIVLYVGMLEVLVFRTSWQECRQQRWLMLWCLVFILIPILLGFVAFGLFHDELLNYSSRNFTLLERLLTQCHVLMMYAQSILLPRISLMTLYQDDFQIVRTFDFLTILLLVLIALLPLLILLSRKTLPVLGFGIAWFLISHMLESTVLPLELVFEHRNYLAAAGLLLILFYYGLRTQALPVFAWCLLLYVLLMAFQASIRARVWGNEELLLTMTVNDHPRSVRGRVAFANFLFSQGKFAQSFKELESAMMLDPKDAGSPLNLAFFKCLTEQDSKHFMDEANVRLERFPVSVYALNGLDNITREVNKGNCKAVSLAELDTLVTTALANTENQQNPDFHGYLYRIQGLLAFMEKRYAQGVIAFRLGYDASGIPQLLGELAGYQLDFAQLQDAEDTIEKLKEVNRALWGRETHVLNELLGRLAEASMQSAAMPAAEPSTP